ncbi:MAG TPA: arginine--tRNA ligase, partial [Burkholderiales bacterium]|nr:arginine--tRNA ligase [Burkholderiales bacterium]
MSLSLKSHICGLLQQAVRTIAPAAAAPVVLQRPKLAQHGDYACNIALQLAKQLGRNPLEVAAQLVQALPESPFIARKEVAGAGFLNLFLTPAAKRRVIAEIHAAGQQYGESKLGLGQRVLVEFVSANPTGPLHVGHGRGAAYGASLANVLAAAGFSVWREYYVNDAGRQMDILALSTWLRYLERFSGGAAFPANCYQGDYVKAMAQEIYRLHGERYRRDPQPLTLDAPDPEAEPEAHLDHLIARAKQLLGQDYRYIHDFALNEQLGDCRHDLLEFGVAFDAWFSEQSRFDSGMVERVLCLLEKQEHVYVQDGAKWFRASRFGDEKDRVVQRENGEYTYFASDIAYHYNKIERGFDRAIDVWGADHHGYVPRIKGVLSALGLDAGKLEVALVQFAVLYRDGKKIPMSTRAGEFVTLRELRGEVGNDAARFFYVLRKSDQHLDFDLDLAKSETSDNPVYYIQYAHARVCSVIAQWGGDPNSLLEIDTEPLEGAREMTLLERLRDYPEVIENAARELSPHLIAFYLRDLAAEFHSYYNATRILVDDERLKLARLSLAVAVRQVIRNGLT